MKLNFGNILTRSWHIIWKHKVLWIFGILAGFAEGGSSGNSNSSSDSNYNSNGSTSPFSGGQVEQYREQFIEFFQQYMLIFIAVCLFILLLSLVFSALGMMGRIGMIKGVSKVENGAEVLAFGEIWSESMPYFWRIFGLNFLIGLAVLILIIPAVILAFATAGIGLACLIPLICILIPVSWAVRLILEQGQIAIVQENLSMIDGFKRGYEILKSDIGGIIVMALILGVGSFIIGLVLALPLILAVLPLIFTASSFGPSNTVPATVWVTLACCAVYLPILIFLSGIITAYKKTAWMLTYLQLTKPEENTPIVLQADA